jgi:hypothetical protein
MSEEEREGTKETTRIMKGPRSAKRNATGPSMRMRFMM